LPRRVAAFLVVVGLVMAASTLGVMVYANSVRDTAVARTLGLTLFSLATIFLSLEVNDHFRSVFSRETFENRRLIQMSGWSLLATFLVTELGFMQHIFTTVALTLTQWLVCIALSSTVIWLFEVVKIYRRRAFERAAGTTARP
jgi:Ca2+-transporting ATPase